MSDPTRLPNQQVVPRPVRPLDERAFVSRGHRSMTDLPKAYTPHDVEGAIYERWLAADVFAPDGAGSTADPSLPPFTIIQPPPNITGSLHLGHAQRTAVEDLMIRHARMRGHRALFLPGLDHASIAAQFVLDGILAREGESRQSLGRERYLDRMHAFVATTREQILAQQRRVGGSFDWGRLRYTMDDGSAKAVRTAFERLYLADLAYRTEALVNWCPGCRTSVSDLEVVSTPETGSLWSIRYHLIDEANGEPEPDATITVATTRPETILGDTAVAVHPDDPRYTSLVGRQVRIPFVDRDVPIIADDVVDPAFGTGAVKITPAHDRDDYETGLRYGLAAPTILADDATIAHALRHQLHQTLLIDVIEEALDICVQNDFKTGGVQLQSMVDGHVAVAAQDEAEGGRMEEGSEDGVQEPTEDFLGDSVFDPGNTERAKLSFVSILRNKDPAQRQGLKGAIFEFPHQSMEVVHEVSAVHLDANLIDPRGASIALDGLKGVTHEIHIDSANQGMSFHC
jgi:leucyl-tRNA synthetase